MAQLADDRDEDLLPAAPAETPVFHAGRSGRPAYKMNHEADGGPYARSPPTHVEARCEGNAGTSGSSTASGAHRDPVRGLGALAQSAGVRTVRPGARRALTDEFLLTAPATVHEEASKHVVAPSEVRKQHA